MVDANEVRINRKGGSWKLIHVYLVGGIAGLLLMNYASMKWIATKTDWNKTPVIENQVSSQVSTIHGNCLLDAMVKYGHIYDSSIHPAFFFMNTSATKAFFFSVPGDEEHWRKISKKYSWQGATATAVFVGEFFRRLSEKGPSARSDISLIDIGGNMGQEAVIAGKYGFSSVTFEVVARSVTTILFNLAANCLQNGNNNVVLSGVGKQTGVMTIDSRGFTAGKGYNDEKISVNGDKSLIFGNFTTSDVDQDQDQVIVWSMDDYFLNRSRLSSRPYLLKIDCEGCEAGALEGSFGILQQYPPHYILVEITPTNIENNLIATLKNQFGYLRSFIVDQDDVWVRNQDINVLEADIFSLGKKEWIEVGKPNVICDLLLVHENAIDLGFF